LRSSLHRLLVPCRRWVIYEGESLVFRGKPMRCSKCKAENPPGKKFCGDCGAPLANLCPKCGVDNPAGKRFCGECGTVLGTPAAATDKQSAAPIRVAGTPASETLEGERKTVTALFADIKGSTELMRDLDPEEARTIVDPVLQLMMAAVHRYDGYVAQSTGDGIFALFGAPVAHEDHPQRALHAALAMQEELRRYADRLRTDGKIPVEARVGVNTGEVVVRTIETGGHTEYTPVGHVTNLAARMQTVAPTGGIAISEDTRRLVEGYFELRALGPTAIKGIAESVNVFEVIGTGLLRGHFELATRRGLTRFVGRERELTELQSALELARSGHGQVVAVVAEAGTGKSRLVYEFKATLSGDCGVLEAYSVSHGRASEWLPVLELLRGYFGIEGDDDPSKRREKLRVRLSVLDSKLNDTLPYLFGLLGIQENPDPLAQMDSQIRRRRILEVIKRIILSEALKHPIVVIFEDLHWIDSESQALLDLLADSIANSRVLLLVNYRPEYHHEWANKSYYLQLRLGALARENADTMLMTLLGDATELMPIKQLVVERTEGNPFFIEEFVQALFDDGALVRNGAIRLAHPTEQVRLPPTVQGVLAERIDRLPVEHKQLLQRLAVVGRESRLSLIQRLTSTAKTQVERMLSDLQSGDSSMSRRSLATRNTFSSMR
jgi:class 3 adenylate cyclase